MAHKIYTKTGDKGETSLIGGSRVKKNHLRIEAYGTVDELNSWMGLLRDSFTGDIQAASPFIKEIQNCLFVIGSNLANDEGKSKMQLPNITENEVKQLEEKIDEMESVLEPMKYFVLPGGNEIISKIHVTRCVCRRAERNVISIEETITSRDIILQYLNRLSDYLFVLSRYSSHLLKVEETPWIPKK